ncbi:MAG: hypothetical protein ACFE0O_09960 [Opitutales bacterium]
MKWTPITFEEFSKLFESEKKSLNGTLARLLDYVSVPVCSEKIERYNRIENVWVMAESGGLVLFYDDVEDGFEIGEKNEDGIITCEYANQWTLEMALNNLKDQLSEQDESGQLRSLRSLRATS